MREKIRAELEAKFKADEEARLRAAGVIPGAEAKASEEKPAEAKKEEPSDQEKAEAAAKESAEARRKAQSLKIIQEAQARMREEERKLEEEKAKQEQKLKEAAEEDDLFDDGIDLSKLTPLQRSIEEQKRRMALENRMGTGLYSRNNSTARKRLDSIPTSQEKEEEKKKEEAPAAPAPAAPAQAAPASASAPAAPTPAARVPLPTMRTPTSTMRTPSPSVPAAAAAAAATQHEPPSSRSMPRTQRTQRSVERPVPPPSTSSPAEPPKPQQSNKTQPPITKSIFGAFKKKPVYKQEREATANEWKCPECGLVNANYVTTCACGYRKTANKRRRDDGEMFMNDVNVMPGPATVQPGMSAPRTQGSPMMPPRTQQPMPPRTQHPMPPRTQQPMPPRTQHPLPPRTQHPIKPKQQAGAPSFAARPTVPPTTPPTVAARPTVAPTAATIAARPTVAPTTATAAARPTVAPAPVPAARPTVPPVPPRPNIPQAIPSRKIPSEPAPAPAPAPAATEEAAFMTEEAGLPPVGTKMDMSKDWVCFRCHRTNASYVTTCACGVTKRRCARFYETGEDSYAAQEQEDLRKAAEREAALEAHNEKKSNYGPKLFEDNVVVEVEQVSRQGALERKMTNMFQSVVEKAGARASAEPKDRLERYRQQQAAPAQQSAEETREPKFDEWKCPNCGTINNKYTDVCSCGFTQQQARIMKQGAAYRTAAAAAAAPTAVAPSAPTQAATPVTPPPIPEQPKREECRTPPKSVFASMRKNAAQQGKPAPTNRPSPTHRNTSPMSPTTTRKAVQAAPPSKKPDNDREPYFDEWKCPECGTINNDYVTACSCGCTQRRAKRLMQQGGKP